MVKNTAYLVSAFVGQKVLSFVYFTIVARAVGVDGTGRYFLAVQLTTMFSIFVDLGLANVLVREVAKRKEQAGTLLANVLGMKLILAAVTVVAVLITARILNYHPETQFMITIACAVMVLDSVHLVLYAAMRGFQNLRYEAIGVVSGQAVIIGSGTVFISMHLPLYFLIVALLLGSIWNVVWAVFALRRKFGVAAMFRLDRSIVKFFWAVTIPFALAGIFSRIYSYIDSVMLSKLISESAVGIYGVAYKIAFAFQFMPMAFAAAVYPAMSEQYVSDRQKLGHLLSVSMSYLLLMVVPLAVGIATLARPLILTLYGPDFLGSVMPLQLLMFSLIFAFLYWPAGSLLNASDRQAKNTLAMGITMAANIILNAILIPKFGPTGAAFAALIGNLVLWGSALWFSRAVTRFDTRKMALLSVKTCASAAAMAVVLIALTDKLHVGALVPIGVLVYAGAMLILGGVTWAELKQVAGVFLKRGRGISDIVP